MGYGGSNILLLVGQFSYNKLFVLYVDPFQKAQDCQNTSDIAPDVNSCIPKPAPLIMDLFIAVLFATMPYLNCIPFWLVKSAFISHIYIVSQLWSNWYFYLHSSTNAFLADNCFGDNFIVPHFLLLGKFYSPFLQTFCWKLPCLFLHVVSTLMSNNNTEYASSSLSHSIQPPNIN